MFTDIFDLDVHTDIVIGTKGMAFKGHDKTNIAHDAGIGFGNLDGLQNGMICPILLGIGVPTE